MSLIELTDLTFSYDGSPEPVFEGLTLQLDTDWKLGFTGRNGRGKTTLLRLLAGQLPCGGSIAASVNCVYFPYPVDRPEQTARAVAAAAAPEAEEWQFQRELGLLDLPEEILDRPFATLSFGERTKVLLAALFLRDDAYPLIDEPTNHLDLEGRRKLASYLSRKRGFLLVSHDRDFLDRCTDHTLALTPTGAQVRRGSFSVWWENKQRQDDFERARQEKLQKDIGRLNEAARRASAWSDRTEQGKFGVDKTGAKAADRGYVGHQAAKLMKRSKAIQRRREEAVEEKSRLLRDVEKQETLLLRPRPNPPGRRLLELRDVSVAYGGRTVCAGVGFEVCSGERIALRGPNGCGKTSLLRLALGELTPAAGRVETRSGLVISCVSQSTDSLSGSLTDFLRGRGLDATRFHTVLRKLDFPRSQFVVDLSRYSAGQKKKVLLAASLCEEADLYIWDEPLNYVDVLSRMQVEELILSCRPTLLFVEHDGRFCGTVATRTVDLG